MQQEELRRALGIRFHHVFSHRQPGESLEEVLGKVLDSMTESKAEDVEAVSVMVSTGTHKLGIILKGTEAMVRYKGPKGEVEIGQV